MFFLYLLVSMTATILIYSITIQYNIWILQYLKGLFQVIAHVRIDFGRVEETSSMCWLG